VDPYLYSLIAAYHHMSSGSSSGGSASGENVTAPASQEEVIPSEVSPLQRVIACYLVLGVGKDRLYAHDVDDKDTKSFRKKPYGDSGDCACSFASLNELYAAAKVRFGGSAVR
jgi:hypothetical protein